MGRPVPQPGEQLWLDDDREAVLEWQREQALRCPGCGNPVDEAWGDEHQDPYVSRRWTHEAFTCWPCRTRDIGEKIARSQAIEEGPFSGLEGIHVVPRKRPLH